MNTWIYVIFFCAGKMMGLPPPFLSFTENSIGGGVIQVRLCKIIFIVVCGAPAHTTEYWILNISKQGSASECVLVALLAARAQAIKKLKKKNPEADEGLLLSKLMAYCSKEAHSCLEKGAMIAFVKLRILEPDENFSLQGSTLKRVKFRDRNVWIELPSQILPILLS